MILIAVLFSEPVSIACISVLNNVTFPINLWAAEEPELNKAQIKAIICDVDRCELAI